jgi:Skp family chaperone for outer membrane proteins
MVMVDKNNPNDLDQIRELIFGQQIRENKKNFDFLNGRIDELKGHLANTKDETSQRFKNFEKEVHKMQKDLEAHIEKVKKEQIRSLESANTQIKKLLDQLDQEKTDRIQLGNLLIDAGMKIKGENLMETLKKGAESA